MGEGCLQNLQMAGVCAHTVGEEEKRMEKEKGGVAIKFLLSLKINTYIL